MSWKQCRAAVILAGAAIVPLAAPASATPVFNLTFTSGTSVAAQNAFTAAANIWAASLADSVTIELLVGTAALSPGVLASANSVQTRFDYSDVRNALVADASSAADTTATANLQAGPNLKLLTNATTNNPNGNSSFTPYLDSTGQNTARIRMTNANAKALGLAPIAGATPDCFAASMVSCDASILFSTGFGFDTDPGDGIASGLFDFVGIAVHEIGHALGFISGVDVLEFNIDTNTNLNSFGDDDFTVVAPLDLFRCSAASAASSALDWTVGSNTGDKLFSLDGCGSPALARFSTGVNYGDGEQASHWQDNQGYGIMDPTFGTGEQGAVTPLDLLAFDAIGWNLAQAITATPEPASALTFVLGLTGLAAVRRRATAATLA